ncbi:MAG: hypothetical protein ACK4OM_02670 [Alphaproteobacteria bacterium]
MTIITTYGIFEKECKKFLEDLSSIAQPSLTKEEIAKLFLNDIATDLITEMELSYKNCKIKGNIFNPPELKSTIENSYKITMNKYKTRIIGDNDHPLYEYYLVRFLKNISNKTLKIQGDILEAFETYDKVFNHYRQIHKERSLKEPTNVNWTKIFEEIAEAEAESKFKKIEKKGPEFVEHLKFCNEVKIYLQEKKVTQVEKNFQSRIIEKRQESVKSRQL